MKHTHLIQADTSQHVWEKVNEEIFILEEQLKANNQGKDGNALYAYNLVLYMKKAWVDPEFDFGKIFGHQVMKWTTLVNNYVDMNYLDIIRNDIVLREKKRQSKYNVAMHFTNDYKSGKDCLISLAFSRRMDHDCPVMTLTLRASELTKRLLWDLLLAQRMGEYVYGKKTSMAMYVILPMGYINAETFTMYSLHREFHKFMGKNPVKQPFQEMTYKLLEKFSTVKPESISYKAHRRAANQLQSIYKGKTVKAKELDINLQSGPIVYPPDAFTDSLRKAHRKQIKEENLKKKNAS